MLIRRNIIIILLFLSTAILEDLDDFIKYSAYSPDVNLTVSLFEKEYSQNEVKGIQFDVFYDIESLVLNELTCLIDGATFEYVSINENQLRCVIFNLNGKSFNKSELSKLIILSFSQKNNFYNQTDIKLKNFIIVGNYGEDISSNYISNSFKINFNKLKPKSTYMHRLENNMFSDSVKVSFQLHQSANVNLAIYDIFDFKKKTVIDEYMNMGIYDRYINSYDELQEKFSNEKYKIKLMINYKLKDSIYVVYKGNNN